jgi:hypothetical protein
MTRTTTGIALVAILGAPVLVAQQPAARTFIITGRVTTAGDATGVLRGARVSVVSGGAAFAPIFTDKAGEFRVSVRGNYTLAISKAGFAPATVSARASASAQPVQIQLARGASIAGQVVDETGSPVWNARVRARGLGAGGGDFSADTDDNGAFRIGSLPAGRYELHSERARVDLMSHQVSIDNQLQEQVRAIVSVPAEPLSETVTVDVGAGEDTVITVVHRVDAVTPPDAPIGGAVTGVVSDEFGEPLERVDVRLWQLRYDRERYIARPVGAPRRTDDRGQYRQSYVPPGKYLVVATSDDNRFAPVYYPDANAVNSALPITIARRQEVSSINVQFTRAQGARVFGFALDAAGDALRGSVILQASRRSGAIALPPRGVEVRPDGTFELLNVPPGEYSIRAASRGLPSEQFAMQFITVSGPEVPPITLRTVPTAVISGRIETEAWSGALPSGIGLSAVIDPDYETRNVNGSVLWPVTAVKPGGTFEMRGPTGPARLVIRTAPAGWWLKSAVVGGINAAHDPVVFSGAGVPRTDVIVVLSATAGTIAGRVMEDAGTPADNYRVIVFSTDSSRWFGGSPYVRITGGPDTDDGFTVTSVPPGDYWVAAVDEIDGDGDTGDWQNPDVLNELVASARRMTVGERQRTSADLRLIHWAR